MRRVAKDLGELTDDNTLQEMIERADFDQDGLVSEEEFYALLTKKAYWVKKTNSTSMIIFDGFNMKIFWICL